MSIYHDAYLFSPDKFADFIQQNMPGQSDDWQKLIEKTLIFAEDSFVLELSDNYGGWDYESIKAELAEEVDDKPYLVQFIFMIYLYKYLGHFSNHSMGLAHDWHTIENSNLLSEDDKNLLIYGHPFTVFAQKWHIEQTLLGRNITNDLHPFSTGGQAGYLSHAEVSNLYERIQTLILEQASTDIDMHSAIVKAKAMIEIAIKAKTGLCLIISG